ncbi:MAG TPA: GTPase HflX [Coriobacteriia bacterium]|nr:GTPase HflX [Coriobacteriia bacterium]
MTPQQRRYPETGEDRLEHRDIAVLVGIDRERDDWPIEESIAELERLADTADVDVAAVVTQRLDRPNPRTFIGSGKAEEVAETAKSVQANLVIFDDELTPSQQLNIEKLLPETRVIDRTALILEIFAMHASTREGKLQVELAQQEYVLPRLRGMWGHLERERLGGGRGTRFGAGESQLETDRRMARRRIAELRRLLQAVSNERQLQRKRRARSGIFRVALVGYTNAGKSTLLNALTGAGVLSADMLFATLDSTTRRLDLPEGRQITVTDTVGFINKLPHGLVEAFKSTLDEVTEADLLLYVTDASAPQREAQMQAVREVLGEIGAHTTPNVVVLNKVDSLGADEIGLLKRRYPEAAFVSALTGEGIEELVTRIAEEAARGSVLVSALVPYTRGDLVQLAHERAQIISEHHTDAGTHLVLRASSEVAVQFKPFPAEAEAEATVRD